MNPEFLRAWLKSARRGDDSAFARLVEATRETLFWTARRMVGRDALAEEILQDAYLSLWGLADSKLPDNPEAWLRRSVSNRALDVIRREENRRPHLDAEELPLESPPHMGPIEQLGTREAEERLQRALDQLPSKMRVAIVLKMSGYEYEDIASALGVAESTVRNHVLQARQRLAPLFGRE